MNSRDAILGELAREEARFAELDRAREDTRRKIESLRSELAAVSANSASSVPPLQVLGIETPRTAAEKVQYFDRCFAVSRAKKFRDMTRKNPIYNDSIFDMAERNPAAYVPERFGGVRARPKAAMGVGLPSRADRNRRYSIQTLWLESAMFEREKRPHQLFLAFVRFGNISQV